MILRPATPEDVARLADLETETFGVDAWSSRLVHDEVTAGDGYAVVVVEEGDAEDPVGFALTRRAGEVVDLQRIAVSPGHRRRGLAGLLLEDAVSRAVEDGAEAMLLEVSADNTAGLAFYAATGFVEIARRSRYYRDGSDAVVLRRPLRGAPAGGRG